jgi:NADPH:quinone reductase-like Zn-dependent oxidoreductase
MYLKPLELHGSSQATRAAFRHLVGYIAAGKVKAILGGLYRLSDFHRAQSDFMAKGFVGKLVVVPDAQWDRVNAELEDR